MRAHSTCTRRRSTFPSSELPESGDKGYVLSRRADDTVVRDAGTPSAVIFFSCLFFFPNRPESHVESDPFTFVHASFVAGARLDESVVHAHALFETAGAAAVFSAAPSSTCFSSSPTGLKSSQRVRYIAHTINARINEKNNDVNAYAATSPTYFTVLSGSYQNGHAAISVKSMKNHGTGFEIILSILVPMNSGRAPEACVAFGGLRINFSTIVKRRTTPTLTRNANTDVFHPVECSSRPIDRLSLKSVSRTIHVPVVRPTTRPARHASPESQWRCNPPHTVGMA
mmetsp:Transcript_12491/g.44923  ORF Transcript_12491/g.44923 Transcript_12491/m.44923 type:complete len:284 (-) Transcript_12491:1580-2431(-)